jgi:ubiquinone/menaquinone biosynthesis C-methylase UbiE
MKKANLQSQWDESAEAWADFVRTGKDWTRDELNNPAMFKMLGSIRRKRILDLCCGEGYNSRILARKGAKVIGVDFSERMISLAIQEEEKEALQIEYHVLDARDLHLFKKDAFEIVACFMALQDIEDYQGAVREVYRVLRKPGHFVFAIPHPCFEVRLSEGRRIGGWVYEKGTEDESTETALNLKIDKPAPYFAVDRYFDAHSYIIPWEMERLTKHFRTTSFHRTLTDYAEALHNAGFHISRLKEPKPTKKGLTKYPEYFGGNLRIPQSIVVEAKKC